LTGSRAFQSGRLVFTNVYGKPQTKLRQICKRSGNSRGDTSSAEAFCGEVWLRRLKEEFSGPMVHIIASKAPTNRQKIANRSRRGAAPATDEGSD